MLPGFFRPAQEEPYQTDDVSQSRGKLGPGNLVTQYCVFVSSGDDAIELRNRVRGLISNSLNPGLASYKVRFEADLWERQPPRRLFGRETVDDEFVERAANSDLVMTLLLARLGKGTKKEIKAVLKSETELKALWFVNRSEAPSTEVGKYLHKLAKQQRLRYKRAGRPETPESSEAIVQVLFDAAVEALTRRPEDFRELR
jgi:hypothetical protein